MYVIVAGEAGITLVNHFGTIVDVFVSVSDARSYIGDDPSRVVVCI